MNSIMYPATALLHSQLPPLVLQRQPILMESTFIELGTQGHK